MPVLFYACEDGSSGGEYNLGCRICPLTFLLCLQLKKKAQKLTIGTIFLIFVPFIKKTTKWKKNMGVSVGGAVRLSFSFNFFFPFLDAAKNLYKRVCP